MSADYVIKAAPGMQAMGLFEVVITWVAGRELSLDYTNMDMLHGNNRGSELWELS